jgi:hypothetical protein
MTDLNEVLERLRIALSERSPLIADLVHLVREGELSVEEGVRDIWIAVGQDEQLAADAEDIFLSAFGVKESSGALARLPDREQLLERWGFREEDLVYQPHPDRPTKMLHPLLMGAIVELLQFDGDVPELRSGKLPEGGSPAVPVRTTARNPVVVGAMLRAAREQVTLELAAAERDHASKMSALVETVGIETKGVQLMLQRETSQAIGVPGYRPGHAAAFREVEPPTTAELARLPFKEKQRLAHLALTSTQGRRSVSPVIADMILESLQSQGYRGITSGSGSDIFADVEWCMQIDGGHGERNPNFNYIDVAARTLSKKLGHLLAERSSLEDSFVLQVSPVNEIAERVVGWRAVLCQPVQG